MDIKSRKLWMAIILGVTTTWLLKTGSISDVVWSQFMTANVVAYVMGNVGEHFAKK